MNSNDHQNSICVFSADLVAYLYDETSRREKSRFEAHLAECSICPVELAEFADVRFAVREWRDDLAQMPTPALAIPFENPSPAEPSAANVSDSWLARLRRLFTLSPARLTAAAALAILIVGGGLFFFAISADRSNQIAKSATPNANALSPTAETKEIQSLSARSADSESAKNASRVESASKSPEILSVQAPEVAAKTISAQTAASRTSTKTSNVRANERRDVRVADRAPRKIGNFQRNSRTPIDAPAPTLSNYEEIEDETPRLADLFAEVETED